MAVEEESGMGSMRRAMAGLRGVRGSLCVTEHTAVMLYFCKNTSCMNGKSISMILTQ